MACDGMQRAVAAFLGDPRTWDGAAVERHETHGAIVFLAGDRACKMKRAVRFPYMDYSTLERRERACRDELALNRRTAPDLYLSVEPVVRRTDGTLGLGGEGEPVEWVVMMRRFPQEALLDALAARGALTQAHATALAEAVARFHAEAETVDPAAPWGRAAAMREILDDNLDGLAASAWFDADETRRLATLARARLDALAPVLERRRAAGRVRRCHGDLHLRNVCLIDGRPTLFDAIEFNDAFAWIDVLYDVAFLVMDLEHRGLRAAANAFLNRYLLDTDEFAGLSTLPLFLANRAMVRAKVAASTAEAVPDRADALKREARGYFDAARGYLDPPPPVLVAVGGLSGSGKSTLAARLAPDLGAAPGAVHLRSDVLRKRLFGVAETERLPESAYSAAASGRVFAAMFEKAEAALAAGQSVVVDAVFGEAWQRDRLEAVAAATGAAWRPVWLDVAPERLIDRVAARRGDASDATPEVVRRQLADLAGPEDWPHLAAEADIDAVARDARALLRPDGGRPSHRGACEVVATGSACYLPKDAALGGRGRKPRTG